MAIDFSNLPSSREYAKEIGATHFFTGVPCINGHIAVRRTNGSRCLECAREASKEWHASNSSTINIRKKDDRSKKLTQEKDRNKRWRDRVGKEYFRKYYHEKKASNTKYRIDRAVSRGIGKSIIIGSKNKRKWESIVGYSVEELMDHLERLFAPGMSWKNYGEWHIDHIVPKSAFNYETPDDLDFLGCWALVNLQPMWAVDNRVKSDRLVQPFQPSLLLRHANDNAPDKNKLKASPA